MNRGRRVGLPSGRHLVALIRNWLALIAHGYCGKCRLALDLCEMASRKTCKACNQRGSHDYYHRVAKHRRPVVPDKAIEAVCRRGHSLDGENLRMVAGRLTAVCIICQRMRQARFRVSRRVERRLARRE